MKTIVLSLVLLSLTNIASANTMPAMETVQTPNMQIVVDLDWYIGPWLGGFQETTAIFKLLASTFPEMKVVARIDDPMMYGSWEATIKYLFSAPTTSTKEIQHFLNNQLREKNLAYITMKVELL